MDTLACTECMWVGKKEDAPEWICPECDAPTELINNDYLPHEQSFNWNKK